MIMTFLGLARSCALQRGLLKKRKAAAEAEKNNNVLALTGEKNIITKIFFGLVFIFPGFVKTVKKT